MAKKKKSESETAEVKNPVEKPVESTPPADSVKHSIPMANRSGDEPTSSGSSVADRFRKKLKPNTKAVKDNERAVINIDDDAQNRFVEFACVKEIFDKVEARKERKQKDVSSSIYAEFVDVLWRSKSKPQNPSIKARNDDGIDAEGIFIVAAGAKMSVTMPEVMEDETPENALVRGLIEAGVSEKNARFLVKEEVCFFPTWRLSFTDLMRGEVKAGKIADPTPLQRTAAEILLCVINGEDLKGNSVDAKGRLEVLKDISDDGWDAIQENIHSNTTYAPMLVDSADFLDRVCNYANSKDELEGILTVFKPQHYCSRVKFDVSSSLADKKDRMVDQVRSILDDPSK
jgi:hypothetical protein